MRSNTGGMWELTCLHKDPRGDFHALTTNTTDFLFYVVWSLTGGAFYGVTEFIMMASNDSIDRLNAQKWFCMALAGITIPRENGKNIAGS